MLSERSSIRRDGEWLPVHRHTAGRRRARFWRRIVAVVTCFALGAVLAGGVVVWRSRDTLVASQRVALDTLGEAPTASASETASESAAPEGLSTGQTVMLVGDDSGDDVDGAVADLATGEREGHRTDTIMILRIDPESGRVTGINFPRDLYLQRCDGTFGRINGAWDINGADCLVETVRDFAGITIDHYIEVNFAGFVQIVDAVGGVPMYLEEPMNDPKAHIDLPAGCVTLDGRSALGFVRSRADSDFGRIARQQRFLKELADQGTSLGVLANPVKLYKTVEAVSDALTMDDALGISTLRQFATTLRGVDSGDISMATIPTVTNSSTGAYYEEPIKSESQALLTAFKTGTLAAYLGEEPADDPAPSESSSEPNDAAPTGPTVPLDELSPVRVLNTSGIAGLARRTAEVLEAAGMEVLQTGDSSRTVQQVTIAYPPGTLIQAESLRDGVFPDAQLQPDSQLGSVTVLLDDEVVPEALDVAGSTASELAVPPDAPSSEAATEEDKPEYDNAEAPPAALDC